MYLYFTRFQLFLSSFLCFLKNSEIRYFHKNTGIYSQIVDGNEDDIGLKQIDSFLLLQKNIFILFSKIKKMFEKKYS